LASGHRIGFRHSAAGVLLARGVPLTSVSQTSLASMRGQPWGLRSLGVDDDSGVTADADQRFGRQ
jgi:hypothetical protein